MTAHYHEFELVKDQDERILWESKPELIPFLLTGLPFFIIGILWALFDSIFFMNLVSFDGSGFNLFIIGFMLIHLFPFYGSIFNLFRLAFVHKNTAYAITNKRLMLKTGFFGLDFKMVDYDRIQNLEVNVNPLEKLLNVGTIKIFTGEIQRNQNGSAPLYTRFIAIKDPYEAFKRIKQVSLDIKSDLNYPNQFRPDANPGYTTDYKRDTDK